MASEHKAPRSLAVESVREGRVARQPEAKDMKMVFEAFTPFWPAMDGNASGLVNDQHHRVAVKEAGGQRPTRSSGSGRYCSDRHWSAPPLHQEAAESCRSSAFRNR